MKTRVHLISMPWAHPTKTPIQIGCLKAYIDGTFKGAVDVKTYSPFLGITFQPESGRFRDFYETMSGYGEIPYLLMYANRFGFPGGKKTEVYTRHLGGIKVRRREEPPLTPAAMRDLERATCRYIDDHIAPHLIADGLNVVGFTLNFDQTYASAFCGAYLRRKYPARKYLFLYGGMSITLTQTAQMLRTLGAPGLGVIGEGEKKLEWIVSRCLEARDEDLGSLEDSLAEFHGIYKIERGAELHSREAKNFETQFKSIDELPLPDYREYFEELRSYCSDEAVYADVKKITDLVLEGTRGCFAHCDFCGLNFTWDGFRKKPASLIAQQTAAAVKEYALPRIVFADNVCDTWAEDYARTLIDRKLLYDSFMELRAHHPEGFWTLLALSGASVLQIGVESVSPHLLGKMGKGTKVIQNLRTQKYLCELGIKSNSNLITHHPRSNLEDILETRRVIEHTPHFQTFFPWPFYLSTGSPLYNGLTPEQKRSLTLARTVKLPRALAWLSRYAVDFCFETPESLALDERVKSGWDQFLEWHKYFLGDETTRGAALTVARLDEGVLLVRDSRFGRYREHLLEGELARILDACHGGLRQEEIGKAAGLGAEPVRRGLSRLLEDKLVFQTEDFYLTLALRPRQELVDAFLAAEAAGRLPAAQAQPQPAAQP